MPTTSPDGPTNSAARNATSPTPHPTSSMVIPGAMPASTKKRRVMGSIEPGLSDEAVDLTFGVPEDVSGISVGGLIR
jgi:hypothetical protein